jgi:hypothetical protein
MLATGAHGIGHKGSNLDFHGNHGNSGKPVTLDLTTNTPYPLGEKWGVPAISMIPLSEKLKAEVAGALTGRGRTNKGILTLLGQGLGPERVIQGPVEDRGMAAGALTEAEIQEQIDAFAQIATACENETRAALNATGGKVDPAMSLHSLFGHRSAASVKKGIDVGDIVGHEEYTKGVDFRKACGKTCVPCLLGNARNKPHSACEQAECEAYPP